MNGCRKKYCLMICLMVWGLLAMLAGAPACMAEMQAGDQAEEIAAMARQIDETMAEEIGCKPGTVLAQSDWFVPGDSVSDWLAMDLCLAGVEEDYASYLKQLEAMVTERYAANGTLDPVKATEYHRLAMVVRVLGGDPRAFGKHEDGSPVDLIEEGISNYQGDLGAQGFNGYIWALLALDSDEYEDPEAAVYSRESIIQSLLDGQMEDGAFGLTDTADVDITSMTLQALAPYVAEKPEVKEAVDRALDWLSGQLEDDCGIEYYGQKNPESVSQLLIALSALGIDPDTDARFTRGGQTLLTQLETFRMDNGLFTHELEQTQTDYIATEQALLAMMAVEHLRSGKAPVYQMKDLQAPGTAASGMSPVLYVVIGLAAVLILAGILLLARGKKQ